MPEEEAECRSKINPLLIGRIAYLHSARAAVYLLLNRMGGHVIEHEYGEKTREFEEEEERKNRDYYYCYYYFCSREPDRILKALLLIIMII